MHRAARGLGTALVCCSYMSVALAARVVLVVRPGPRDAVARRIEQELRAEGFEVAVVESDTPSAPDGLAQAAERNDGIAAVSAERSRDRWAADMWVSDRLTGKISRRHLEGAEAEDTQILALRTVELLRASLLELRESHPPRGDLAPPPEIRTWTETHTTHTRRPRTIRTEEVGAAVGAALLTAPGGFPPVLTPMLTLSWRAAPRWYGEASCVLPTSATLTRDEGTATLQQTLALVRLRLQIVQVRGLSAHASLGAGGYVLAASGFAREPRAGTEVLAVAAAGSLGSGGRLVLAPPVALRLDVATAILAPRPVIAFGDRTVASTGRLLMIGSIALEATW